MVVSRPATCENATLPGKRGSVGAIKLKILSWGEYPGSPRWAQWQHKVLLRGRQEGQREVWRCCAAGFENGGKGPKPRDPIGL